VVLQSVLRRARSAGRRGVVAGAVMACTVTAGAVVAVPSGADVPATTAVAAAPVDSFVVQLGPEERVYGPTGIVDFPYFSERTPSGKLLGFISNNDSYRATSRNTNARLVQPKLILKRGPVGKFDKCGAWLIGSVFKVPGHPRHWFAAYHAEAAGKGDNNRCIFHDESVVASVALAESRDGGLTWRKPNYPHNRIITQDRQLTGARAEDATMGRLLRIGDYLYLFYGATARGNKEAKRLHVARSRVSANARPGSWFKYYCDPGPLLLPEHCGFQDGEGAEEGYDVQKGLGGRSTPIDPNKIDPNARVIIPNSFLDRYIALSASGKEGFRLYLSDSPLNDPDDPALHWNRSIPIYPRVSREDDKLVDQWGTRTARSKQLYAYPSIVSVKGDSNVSGQIFYIYYVKLFPGGDFPERYLMRRKVTLSTTTAGPHRVALTTYFNKLDRRRRTSTERPESKAYKAQSTTVYLAGQDNQAAEGYKQVFECKKRSDFLLRVNTCATGESQVRRVGWISLAETDVATIPVYRCFNRAKRNHFASTDPGCLGFRKETRLGYGLSAVSTS